MTTDRPRLPPTQPKLLPRWLDNLATLTREEARIAAILSAGRRHTTIARDLGITPKEARVRLEALLDKVGRGVWPRITPTQLALVWWRIHGSPWEQAP